jgi:hypothetical protein
MGRKGGQVMSELLGVQVGGLWATLQVLTIAGVIAGGLWLLSKIEIKEGEDK